MKLLLADRAHRANERESFGIGMGDVARKLSVQLFDAAQNIMLAALKPGAEEKRDEETDDRCNEGLTCAIKKIADGLQQFGDVHGTDASGRSSVRGQETASCKRDAGSKAYEREENAQPRQDAGHALVERHIDAAVIERILIEEIG